MTLSAAKLDKNVERRLAMLAKNDVVRRIWDKDPTVWGGTPQTPELADRLGWLTVIDWTEAQLDALAALAADVRGRFDRVLLLGMGGSSLAPEVLARSFGRQDGFPSFDMLDSPHPAAVMVIGERQPIERTLFIVASKSGTTIETTRLFEYFWERTAQKGPQFVAITDPGTPLARLARDSGFRAVFENPEDIGGRYAALSLFGMLPAALMGLDVRGLLASARAMAEACRGAPAANPGARLGALIAEAALGGRDKLTLGMDPIVRTFGLWMEQLVAESTGKDGKGVIPVADEDLSEPPPYADDRVFVALNVAGTRDSATTLAFRTLEGRGHPVHHIEIADRYALGGEFFHWEFATAVAGHVLGVNPFDQPNVAEAKQRTSELLGRTGGPEGTAGRADTAKELIKLLDGVASGDYLAILAYMAPSSATDRRLIDLQTRLRDRLRAAVTVAYGPRYLHSTGQLHKGGPPKGHFIQVIDPTLPKLPLPHAVPALANLTWAQAAGDYEALAARGRPIAQAVGLNALEDAVR
jgi:glucose-6-phosphate isomerase